MAEKQARTYWSEKEWDDVLLAARAEGAPEHGDSHDVWRKANEVLPPHRRRAGTSADFARMNAARRGQGRPKRDEVPTPYVAPAPAEPKPEEVIPEPAPVDASTDAIAQIVASPIKQALLTLLYDPELRAAARDLIKEVLAPESTEAVTTGVLWRSKSVDSKRRIVLAAGGKAALLAEGVMRPLMRFYDIRIWDARSQNVKHLRAILQGADAAVVYTSSVSHNGFEVVKGWSKATGNKFHYYNKGLNSLVEDLPGLLGDNLKVTPALGNAS